jgi:DNA-binding CsgD family transcriptional regulator
MAAKQNNTWLGYLDKISKNNIDPSQLSIEGVEKIISLNDNFSPMFHHSIPMKYILDYRSGAYLSVSKSSLLNLGYEPSVWIENGLGLTIDIYHRDDLKTFDQKVFTDRLQIMKDIPAEDHKNYVFSNNFRMKNNKGEYVNILQRNCFVMSDSKGKPLISMGMILDVTHFMKDTPTIQTVDKINPNDNSSETVFKKIYLSDNTIFSRREKEVLLWVTDGLTSKEIAHKMYLSEATVINHRKNMLLKSGAKNVAELISFAVKNHII